MDIIEHLYSLFCAHPQVSTDSRDIKPDSIFFALKGDNFDGNVFAEVALEKGAAAVVIDDASLKAKHEGDDRFVYTGSTLETLQQLARHHRRQLGLPIVAITGTNGKTTTKELLTVVLRHAYRVQSTEGNLNNHIGVPLTLLALRKEHQLAVVEMGASHPGDIEELCLIAEPNYGLITNIGCAHIEGFGSLEGIRQTKGELFDYLRRVDGRAFVNYDDKLLLDMSEGLPRVTYGTTEGAVFRAEKLPVDKAELSIRWWWGERSSHRLATKLVGDYNLPNVLAAVAIGRYFDVAGHSIDTALASYEPSNNRSQLVETRHNKLILDTYNANPSSMQSAIDNFKALATKLPKVLILGDMKELGGESARLHTSLLLHIAEQKAYEEIYLVGSEMTLAVANTPELMEILPIRLFVNTDSLIDDLKKYPIHGRYILAKGSRSIGLEKISPLC